MRTEEQILNGELKEGTLGALNDAVTLVPKSVSGAVFFEIDSGLSGTVVFEATLDDTNWFAISALKLSDGSLITNVTSFADRGVLTSAGYTQVRLRVSVYSSGSSAARLNLVSVGNSPVWLRPTGEVTMANSQGVVIASDQTAIPITVASLPLPSGAATEATLAFIQTAVEILDNFISGARGLVTEDNSAAILTASSAIQTAVEIIDNMISGSEAQVDVVTSALPTGASTSSNQSTANTALAAIQTAVEILDNFISGARGLVTEDNSAAILTAANAIQTAVEIIDNMISGSEAQVDVVTSALPTGASTSANQTTANTALAAIQTAVEIIDNMILGSEAQVDVITSALPSGASTSANQTTEIADLNALNSLAGAVDTIPTQIPKTIAATATPEVLAANGTFFRTAIFIGKKAARTNNAGIVYLGIGISDDTQPIEISPGAVWSITAPPGEKYDLNDWGLDVLNAGDGVIIIYS